MNRRRQLRSPSRPPRHLARAFTLLEVMIAMAIFFMAVFAILELVATSLRNARLLEQPRVDCGLVIADLTLTNKLEEGTDEGDFDKLYPGYHWEQDIAVPDDPRIPVTNGLFHVEYLLKHPDGTVETNLDAFMWKPDSKPVTLP